MLGKIAFHAFFLAAAMFLTAVRVAAQESAPAQEASRQLCPDGSPRYLEQCPYEPTAPSLSTTPTVARVCPVVTPPRAESAFPAMVCIPNLRVDVGAYEVTFAQWRACVADQQCEDVATRDDWDDDLQPVTMVSWGDAQAYVQWLSQRTGEHYRLLTSAEWETAARGGRRGQRYSWGLAKPNCDRSAVSGANFLGCRAGPMDVGSFRPNDFGLYDMHGNVLEWVEDPVGARRIIRGGSWQNTPEELSLSHYQALDPGPLEGRLAYVGFRVARIP